MATSISFGKYSGGTYPVSVSFSGIPSYIVRLNSYIYFGDGTLPKGIPTETLEEGAYQNPGSTVSTGGNWYASPGQQVIANAIGHREGSGANDWESGYLALNAPPAPRPSPFSWSSDIASGKPISGMTASEWTRFCTSIEAMLEYKGKSGYTLTRPRVGSALTAVSISQISSSTMTIGDYCREAVAAINAMGGGASNPRSGASISASYFKSLADALNSIS